MLHAQNLFYIHEAFRFSMVIDNWKVIGFLTWVSLFSIHECMENSLALIRSIHSCMENNLNWSPLLRYGKVLIGTN